MTDDQFAEWADESLEWAEATLDAQAETWPELNGRAVGGPAFAGGAYLVGEHGPELLFGPERQ